MLLNKINHAGIFVCAGLILNIIKILFFPLKEITRLTAFEQK